MNGFGGSPLAYAAFQAQANGLVFLEEFDYPVRWLINTATALPANDSREVPLQIDGSSDFIICTYNGTVYDEDEEEGEVINPDPNYLISFTKDGSGRRMSSAPVHWNNLIGGYQSNKVPGRLCYEVFLPMKATYSVLLENLTAVEPARVELLCHGYKVYYTGPAGTDNDQLRRQIFHVL